MKRFVKAVAAWTMAGAVFLTGCGAKNQTGALPEEGYMDASETETPGFIDEDATKMPDSVEDVTGASDAVYDELIETEALHPSEGEDIPSLDSTGEGAQDGSTGTENVFNESQDDASGTAKNVFRLEENSSEAAQNSGRSDTPDSTADFAMTEAAPSDFQEDIGIAESFSAQKRMAQESYFESCYEPVEDIYWQPSPENTEEYSSWQEKGFSTVMAAPLSTFAADVDTASYSNMRRLFREGYDLESLPEGAVRIEELLNYFSYDFKEPKGNEPFGVTTQISRCPWNEEAELLMVGLKTEDVSYSQAPASNLVFLLDVSGSMDEPDKLPLLQEAFSQLTDRLTTRDRVSIVTYAAEDKIVLQGARGTDKQKIKAALAGLIAEGGTHGSKGIETAYELAQKHFIQGGNNRVILATDGDLNIGMTTEEELEQLITKKKESGVFLSVLGFGRDNLKDNKMETLADKGNGNYAYIDSLREAKKVLGKEMTATLVTVCRDAKIQVEFNPDVVRSYRLLGYENRTLAREDFNDDKKDGGEIGAGHSVTALYEIFLTDPLGEALQDKEIRELKYGDAYRKRQSAEGDSVAKQEEWLTVNIRYKKPLFYKDDSMFSKYRNFIGDKELNADRSFLLSYPVSYEDYRAKPDEDFVFAAAVAEFGLLASHSAWPEKASVSHVIEMLEKLDFRDEYKAEFKELVELTAAVVCR